MNKYTYPQLLENRIIFKNDIDTIYKWIEAGANVNGVNHIGWSPLHEAVYWNRVEIVQILLDVGANVNAVDYFDRTPAHVIHPINSGKTLRLLIAHGADLCRTDRDGYKIRDLINRMFNKLSSKELQHAIEDGLIDYKIQKALTSTSA